MNTPLFTIEETNLSNAWWRVLNCIVKRPGMELTPLLLSLTNFGEIEKIREVLDFNLKNSNYDSIHTVSETIFPNSLYQYLDQDRFALYSEYKKSMDRIIKIDPSNRRGTYFQRLIAFEGTFDEINQLEIIINSLKSGKMKRRSKLQASIFDPNKDHTKGAYQTFPCLQHVTFYKSENDGLILNAFYAIQYLYRRAYGNWLGLINLGKFVANELDLEFERLNCFVGIEKLDDLTKIRAQKILDSTEASVHQEFIFS